VPARSSDGPPAEIRELDLGVPSIADRPGESLYELCRCVISAQVHGIDLLVEPHGGVGGQRR